MLNSTLLNQENTGTSSFDPLIGSQPPNTPYTSLPNPIGGTAITNLSASSPPSAGQQHDPSLTNSYLAALKDQQGATAAAQELSGYKAPDPNAKAALPTFTPEQQKAFQTLMGGLLGIGQPQTPASVATIQSAPTPTMVAGDNSRFTNDPFKTNANALR